MDDTPEEMRSGRDNQKQRGERYMWEQGNDRAGNREAERLSEREVG